jgi:hypothetical protein
VLWVLQSPLWQKCFIARILVINDEITSHHEKSHIRLQSYMEKAHFNQHLCFEIMPIFI